MQVSTSAYCSLIEITNVSSGSDISSYCSALIDAGLSRIPPATTASDSRPSYQGLGQEHIDLLNSGREVLKRLAQHPQIRNTSEPTLLHPDLHMRNIFVSEDDPTIITGFIDWQSAGIEPAFSYANLDTRFRPTPLRT